MVRLKNSPSPNANQNVAEYKLAAQASEFQTNASGVALLRRTAGNKGNVASSWLSHLQATQAKCYRTNSPSKLMQSPQSLFKEMLTQTAKCSRMEKSLPINKKANNPKVQVQRLCTLTRYDGMFANVRPDSLRHPSQHKDRLLCQGRHHHRFNRGRTAKLDPPQMFGLQTWWPIRRFCFGYQPF